MMKGRETVLADLKALHITTMVMNQSPEFINGYLIALLAIAFQWEVEREFINHLNKYSSQIDYKPFVTIERDKK